MLLYITRGIVENLSNTFEQAGDDLLKLYQLLVYGEPTPDEETESKDKILQYLKVIQQAPEGDLVKELVEQAITLASSWDVYDLWFKEVKDLSRIVGEILNTIKPGSVFTPPTSTSATKTTPENSSQGVPGVNLEDIVAKVTGQFKSQIEALQGKISTLEKSLDDKDQDFDKGRYVGARSEVTGMPTSDRPGLKPKLQVPKLKIPAVLAHKPHPPKLEEKPAPTIAVTETPLPSQYPVDTAQTPQPLKPIVVKPIAIKPLIITSKKVEKAKSEPAEIPPVKSVPFLQTTPKPVPVKPVEEDVEVEEPASLQPIRAKPTKIRPVAVIPSEIKPVSVQPVHIKILAEKSEPPLSVEEDLSNLQSVSPLPSSKPVSIVQESSKSVANQHPGGLPWEAGTVPVKPTQTQTVGIKPFGVQQSSGAVRPVSVTPAGPMQIKPISAKPISIKPMSAEPVVSTGANLASTLSSIGRSPSPSLEPTSYTRPVITTPTAVAPGFDSNSSLSESKTDLYSELIALEGRRFAAERRKKELDVQFEKGQLGQSDFQHSVTRVDGDLQDISNRINTIRQKLSTF